MDQLTALLIGVGIVFGGFGLMLFLAIAFFKRSAKTENP